MRRRQKTAVAATSLDDDVLDEIEGAVAESNFALVKELGDFCPAVAERCLLAYHVDRGPRRGRLIGKALAAIAEVEARREWGGP